MASLLIPSTPRCPARCFGLIKFDDDGGCAIASRRSKSSSTNVTQLALRIG